MKSKFLSIKTCIGLLTLFLLGCNSKTEPVVSKPQGKFEGLYKVTYEGHDKAYIWILTDDIIYTIYSTSSSTYLDPQLNLDYENPQHYYIKDNKFYTCSVDVWGNLESLKDCISKDYDPFYNIISIDTVGSPKKHSVVILLEDIGMKRRLKLEKKI